MCLTPDLLFKSLADLTRLRCLVLLQRECELCVCELTYALEQAQPKVSRHLAQMREAGVVLDRRQGLWVHYRLHPDLPWWAAEVLRATADGIAGQSPFREDCARLAQMPNRPGVRCGTTTLQPDEEHLSMTNHRKRVLFLCTGNSCRSQMAEGWARHFGGDALEVRSAGIEAHGKNSRAIVVMREAGIDISAQESTRLTDAMLAGLDLVVTVCGHADEHCPVLPPGVKKVHWPLADPARASGSEEEVMAVFRLSRDDIRERVRTLVAELLA